MLPEGRVLLLQILDHVVLATVHAANEGHQQKLKWKGFMGGIALYLGRTPTENLPNLRF